MTTPQEKIRRTLDISISGMSTRHLSEAIGADGSPEILGAIEYLCVLSPDLKFLNGAWRSLKAGKSAAVLTALENHGAATGKRIFRLSSAMEGLPVESFPTEAELREILESSGKRFELLPNQMIRFNN